MSVRKYLLPGEHLSVELKGQVGTPPVAEVLLIGSVATSDMRYIYLGITEHDLVLVDADAWGKPLGARRVSLSQVKLLKSREGMFADDIVLDTGEPKPVKVRVWIGERKKTRKLVGILSGQESPSAVVVLPSPSLPAQDAAPEMPFWQRYLWGLGAAVVGNLLGLFLGGWLISSVMPNDSGEGVGLLLGLLCWLVVLPGCLGFAALAAWLGPKAAGARPELIKNASALLGFAFPVVTWLIIGVLFVVYARSAG